MLDCERKVSIADLIEAVEYCAESGAMKWKCRKDVWNFSSASKMAGWNARFAGMSAFSTKSGNGYLKGVFLDTQLLAHRVAWAVAAQSWPKGQIDHVNGKRDDNRMDNIRDVSVIENRRNTAIPKTNTSGFIGVSWREEKRRWRASITVGNKSRHLGYFETKDAALIARKTAERQLGFHENHGRPECRA